MNFTETHLHHLTLRHYETMQALRRCERATGVTEKLRGLYEKFQERRRRCNVPFAIALPARRGKEPHP